MSISSISSATSVTASNIVNDAINDAFQDDYSIENDASSSSTANDSNLRNIDDQWLKQQADIMGSLLNIDKNPSASTQFEAAVLQHKNFVNAFSTMTGSLMKSLSRLEQING